MPAALQFFDMEVITQPPAFGEPFAFSLGTNWQPNDLRILFIVGLNGEEQPGPVNPDGSPGPPSWIHVNPLPNPPTNVTRLYWLGDTSQYNVGTYYRRLQTGALPSSMSWQTEKWAWFVAGFVTVRGVDPTTSPTNGGILNITQSTGTQIGSPGTATISSQTVPAAGAMINFMSGTKGTGYYLFNNGSYLIKTPVDAMGASIGVAPTWTPLVSTPKSGSTYYQYDSGSNGVVVAKRFSGSGSTGSIVFPVAHATGGTNYEDASTWFWGMSAFVRPTPDVSASAGAASETESSGNATGTSNTTVVANAGAASETDVSSTAFNPTQGYWISDPLPLSGAPVTASVVRWAASTPGLSTVRIETSINNGASWDPAGNNRPVARLKPGNTNAKSVLLRATLTRQSSGDPKPKITALEVQVSTDVGTDEYVAIGQGMIDKVTVKSTPGTSGGGSTGNTGSSGVIAKGGGQSGGGTSIKVHFTDLSRAIKRNQWQQPYTVPSGLNYGDAAKAIVRDRLPSQTDFNIATTTRITPLLVYGVDQGGDPWQDLRELAQAIGFECFFDPRGVFVFRPVPDPRRGEPVWEFDELANPVVVEAQKELSDEQTFNDIVVIGQSTSTQNPVSAEAFDNDPSSRTYIKGPYGRVVQRLTFSQITTEDQAQDAANATLYNSLGAAETVTLSVVPMPALEPGDVVKVNVSNVKAAGTYMINSMTTPLSPTEPQQLVCFRQSTNA